MNLSANIARIRDVIEKNASGGLQAVTIVAVTKTRPPQEINKLKEHGIIDIGENRVQEWLRKKDEIDPAYRLHHIGQLQTNKVKYLMGHTWLIQSVDRLSLLAEISRRSISPTAVLLQVNTARESSKAGALPEDLPKLFDEAMKSVNISLKGLMCMAPLDGGKEAAGEAFTAAKQLFDEYSSIASSPEFSTLSMGMSGDYDIALRCGANMIRIGSTLFI
ncbi:MAG: YggS family pyridoxal phosphate-dependent enzyme [Christensenellales bacterium]|jgi:pyridoxal phosphate enzyme (YggS family)